MPPAHRNGHAVAICAAITLRHCHAAAMPLRQIAADAAMFSRYVEDLITRFARCHIAAAATPCRCCFSAAAAAAMPPSRYATPCHYFTLILF